MATCSPCRRSESLTGACEKDAKGARAQYPSSDSMRPCNSERSTHSAETILMLAMSMAFRHFSPLSSLVIRCVQLAVRLLLTAPPARTISSWIRALIGPRKPEMQANTTEKMCRSWSIPLHHEKSRLQLLESTSSHVKHGGGRQRQPRVRRATKKAPDAPLHPLRRHHPRAPSAARGHHVHRLGDRRTRACVVRYKVGDRQSIEVCQRPNTCS